MPYEDKTIVCVDCNAEFKFTAEEQKQFAERGFTNGPKRCKTCRDARKASQTSGNRANGNTLSGNSGGGERAANGARGGYGRGAGGGGGGGGGRSFGAGPKQMFPATCAACGKQTEVPFKPSGARPVYCRECFQSQRAASGR